MSFVVLRRASKATWETIGPRLIELSEIEAEGQAREFAHNHPNQEYAVAEVRKIFGMERQVVAREVGGCRNARGYCAARSQSEARKLGALTADRNVHFQSAAPTAHNTLPLEVAALLL